jgi:hypothetical protein
MVVLVSMSFFFCSRQCLGDFTLPSLLRREAMSVYRLFGAG